MAIRDRKRTHLQVRKQPCYYDNTLLKLHELLFVQEKNPYMKFGGKSAYHLCCLRQWFSTGAVGRQAFLIYLKKYEIQTKMSMNKKY